MAMDEILFDTSLIRKKSGEVYPVSAQLEYANSQPRNAQTGVRQTNVGRYDPTETDSVDIGLLDNESRRYFIRFLRGGQGSAVGFRCYLPHDHEAIHEPFGLGDGETTEFKLVVVYSRPGETEHPDVRRIFKPVVQLNKETNDLQLYEADGQTERVIGNPLKIYADDVEMTTGWTVDATTGDVTFDVAPAEDVVLDWSGDYDTPMAFEGNTFTQLFDVPSGAQYVWREMLGPELGLT